jgi:hypothetical protein
MTEQVQWGRAARVEVESTAASRAEARRQERDAERVQTEYQTLVDVRMAEFERRVAEIEEAATGAENVVVELRNLRRDLSERPSG